MGYDGGIDEILTHDFFKTIDFKQLENKLIKPPLKPDPLKFNIDENESKKGEQELKQKLLLFSQNNVKIFKDFYYEKTEEKFEVSLQ